MTEKQTLSTTAIQELRAHISAQVNAPAVLLAQATFRTQENQMSVTESVMVKLELVASLFENRAVEGVNGFASDVV